MRSRFDKLVMKFQGLTLALLLKLLNLSVREVTGIPSVAVECVDIRRNTSGESELLAHN